MKKRLLDYWEDDEYIKEVTDAGYEDILILAQMYITKYAPDLLEETNESGAIEKKNGFEVIEEMNECEAVEEKSEPLQKSENKLQQPKPIHRPSKIPEYIIDLIKDIRRIGNQSCREIAKTLYKTYNFSIHYSTVCRILNGTYKPIQEK